MILTFCTWTHWKNLRSRAHSRQTRGFSRWSKRHSWTRWSCILHGSQKRLRENPTNSSPLQEVHRSTSCWVKGQLLLQLGKLEVQHLCEQSGYHDLLHEWPEQQGSYLIPATSVATALQAAEVSTAAVTMLPFGHEQSDPISLKASAPHPWDSRGSTM